MIDAVQGRKTKSSLNDMDKILKNIFSEAENLSENNDTSSLTKGKEEQATNENGDLLDDLLIFDAQVLTSGSDGLADISDVNELSGGSENQQYKSSVDAIDECEATSNFLNGVAQAPNDFFDADLELRVPDVKQEQQDSYMDSTQAGTQDERIAQLESELLVLKKVSFIGLALAVLALIVSLWLGVSNLAKQKPQEQRVVMDVVDDIDVPVIVADNQKPDNELERAKALEVESKSPEKTLILQEDDISGLNAADEVVKLKKGIKAPVKRWVVNLYSYEQRWEADEKRGELKKKRIPTEMIVVNVKGRRWFRIRSIGFKTRAEAESYATKIKKTLNNGLAWVSKI